MKAIIKTILIGILLATGVTVAKAELPNFRPYGGLDYMFLGLVPYESDEANLGAIRGKLGAELNPYLALEGYAGTGVISDDDVDEFISKLKLTEIWGIYVRGILPLHERVKLYGLLGITRAEFEIDLASSRREHYATSGYSYGLGVEVFPLENLSVVLEFVSLIDELEISGSREDGEPEITAITLGAKYYF
jgi:opacity protein-like surface antigen